MSGGRVLDVLAATPLQQGLLALASADHDGYSVQLTCELVGGLDMERLRRAVRELLGRHPNLGGRFVDSNVPTPVHVLLSDDDLPVELMPAVSDAAAADAVREAQRRRSFDVRRGPLLRFAVVPIAASDRQLLVCTAHHIVLDGWSFVQALTELFDLYRGRGLPPPPSVRRYLHWIAEQDDVRAREHWAARFAGIDEPTLVASSAPEVAVATDGTEPTVVRRSFGAAATARLTERARSVRVTVNTLLQFAVASVIATVTGRSDVVVGATVSGRAVPVPEVERLVGLFIQTFPVRFAFTPAESVEDCCRRLQREFAADVEHGHVGMRSILEAAGRGARFDTLVVFQNAVSPIEPEPLADGLSVGDVSATSLTHYPLVVMPFVAADDLTVDVEARTAELGSLTPEWILDQLFGTLTAIIDTDPSEPVRSIAPPDAAVAARAADVDTSSPPGATTVSARFREHVRSHPERIAVRHGAESITYGELDRRAQALASVLLRRGVGVEDAVAVQVPRSPFVFVAQLAAAMIGAMSVYVDPDLPSARIDELSRQCDFAAVVVPSDEASSTCSSDRLDAASTARVWPDTALYAVFTSGSTGTPKGVIGTHRGILALRDDHENRVYRRITDAADPRPLRIGHGWSFSFDAGWQPTLALLSGHTVVLLDAETTRDPEALSKAIGDHEINMIEMSPSMFQHLTAADHRGMERLAVVGLGGEAISPETWERLRSLTTHPMNFYGPTETTVDAVSASIPDSDSVVIGTPVGRMRAHLLDPWLRPVPDGAVGELYLGGPQVTRGYLGDPARTAGRFVADPTSPGERVYRTGDLARRTVHGSMEYLGRSDDQVKIRGHRIELGEVTAAVQQLSVVVDAAVLPWRRAGGAALRAFVVAHPDAEALDSETVRAALASALPTYMVPGHYTFVERLPLTGNGKLDTAALMRIPAETSRARSPRGPAEQALAAAVEQVVGLAVDPEAELLDHGLDSVALVGFVSVARDAGIDLTIRDVLEAGTVAELARRTAARTPQEALS
ncbi:amino acid adenylation domain-containing protein [Gordonia humi]|uniref:non-ribosomal peptide synthetase n=1 Tax=Gordonia humi TaxID=686429 RepID=UPI0036091C7C